MEIMEAMEIHCEAMKKILEEVLFMYNLLEENLVACM
jgi:hypothetical protein